MQKRTMKIDRVNAPLLLSFKTLTPQVWVTDLDAPEDQCKVFVDAAVERVSCDFLLPTLCEMGPIL
jgi:hypothetical protein